MKKVVYLNNYRDADPVEFFGDAHQAMRRASRRRAFERMIARLLSRGRVAARLAEEVRHG